MSQTTHNRQKNAIESQGRKLIEFQSFFVMPSETELDEKASAFRSALNERT